ncbi:MAG TPA: helix-turn-helix transcriptional regulator [Alphaproteobacteria bacterium]|nr:helix-turn-helix transcriptional regulator [Alphaproteobacteria bacterium]
MSKFSASQLRAARAILNWSRTELAKQTGVSEPTLHRFENNQGEPEARTQSKIRDVLEHAGIEFIGTTGVQMKRHSVYGLDGVEGFKRFMDDVYTAACDESSVDGSKPICICNVDDRLFMKFLGDYMTFHVQRMNNLKKVKVRILLREQDFYSITGADYIEYRWGPKVSGNVPFYAFGDKLGILMLDEAHGPHIAVISSVLVAKAYREQFDAMWSMSKEIPRKKSAK